MTSEGPHHPGQEPDEVTPGAGGTAPYGDRPAQPGNGYGAAGPDLGWAPPPPAGPHPPAPAWGAQQHEQTSAPQWGTPQPPAESGQPDSWGAPGAAQPGWGAQPEQPAPAWGGAAEQPAWAQSQPAARGAAQVPGPPQQAWPQDDPARSGGWQSDASRQQDEPTGWGAGAQPGPQGGWNDGGSHPDDPAQSGGWANGTAQDAPAQSGGWANGTAQDAPAQPGGWADGGQQRSDQPAWAQAEQASPAWAQPEPGARGAAQVPPAEDPARSGGWAAQQDAAASGGWHAGTGAQADGAGQPGGWGAAGTPEDRPRQPDWVIAQDDRPQENAAPAGWGDSAAAAPDDARQGGWAQAEPNGAPARASASVPAGDGGPAWNTGAESPAQWTGGERPAVPDVEPWAPGEAWGRTEAEPASSPAGWSPERADEPPVYQPSPAPGISPANAVPLPPQEQRVPGASLAAAPPADYAPPAPYAAAQPTQGERGDWPGADAPGQPYEAEQPGWGQAAEARSPEPSSPAGPVVPTPRTSPESGAAARASVSPAEGGGAAGRATASASVPLTSRVMPPNDQAALPSASPAPQPRVYGRPARPEPDEPERAEQDGFGPERRAEPGPEPRFDDRDRPPPPHGFAESGQVPSGPPAPPAFPPGMPSFADAPSSNRPVNGVRPHPGAERPAEPFGPPASAHGDPGMPGAPGAYGPPPVPEPAPAGGFPPPFAPPPQHQPGPSWPQAAPDQGQDRFEAFKPQEEPKTEAPTPKVRNGRVLAAVLVAAVLILAVPLGLLTLLGKVGGGDSAPSFDPAVGTCVKKAGEGAAAADCGEADAFTVVSKVDNKDKCADPAQPHVVLPGDGPNRVLCLKPAAQQ